MAGDTFLDFHGDCVKSIKVNGETRPIEFNAHMISVRGLLEG